MIISANEHVEFRMADVTKVYPDTLKGIPYDYMVHSIYVDDSGLDIHPVMREARWGGHHNRPPEFASMLQQFGVHTTERRVLFDGQDNAWYPDTEPLSLFTHNRHKYKRNTILAPLHVQFYKHRPLVDTVPWELKQDKEIWRGTSSGSLLTKYDKPASFFWVLYQMTTGEKREVDYRDFLRYEFVNNTCKEFNVGFSKHVLPESPIVCDIFKDLLKPTVKRDNQMYFKYHIALDGNDWASSMAYTMKSNSLLLMPEPAWHGIFHAGLTAGVDYVEIRRDGSDLGEVLEWCRSNDQECKAIAENGTAHIKQFRPKLEKEIWTKIFSHTG